MLLCKKWAATEVNWTSITIDVFEVEKERKEGENYQPCQVFAAQGPTIDYDHPPMIKVTFSRRQALLPLTSTPQKAVAIPFPIISQLRS